LASPDGPPPPVSNPITGTWRNSFGDKDQKGKALQKFDRVEELVCDHLFCAAVVAIGILSGRLACGNGNEKTLVLQWTKEKSKARKNELGNCGKSSITER
jgi:hypothetical protein